MPQAFIVGGTGQIGLATAELLLDRGWMVTIAHRGGRAMPASLAERGAKAVTVDRQHAGALAQSLREGADLLIDAVAYGPEHGRQLLELQSSLGAIVVVSSSSVYRDNEGRTLDEAAATGFPELPEPITERQTTVDPGPETYSTRKVALECLLLDEAAVPVTVLRPAAISGLGSGHAREWWFVKRILDGRRIIPLAYSGRSRFHPTSAANIAELVCAVAGLRGPRVLNIADPDTPSVSEIASYVAQTFDYNGRVVKLSDIESYPPPIVGRTPWSVQRPFVLDTAAATALGYVPSTTYRQTVRTVCDWLARTATNRNWRTLLPVLASYSFDLFDYEAEDAFLTSASSCTPPSTRPRQGR
jgi:nucleoside-diphosphate-sugar epimerase